MKKLSQLLKRIDDSILLIASIIFIFFIPLFPKFPLIFIEYTYIAIRGDDIFMVVYCLLFLIQLLRKKVVLNRNFLMIFGIYWIFVFISLAFGIFITKTVIHSNIGLMHAARRIEYMVVFFIVLASIKSKKDAQILISSYVLSFFIVLLYGIGQKFFGLPAIQTMNSEFAKGHLLYLTPEARVSSTFAGHYDFAAYLVFTMPLVLGLFLSVQKKITKYFLFFTVILSIFLLVLTASRTSFIAFIASLPVFLLANRKFKLTIIIILIFALFNFFSKDMVNRWTKTIQIKQILVNERTGQVYVPQKQSSKELPAGSLYVPIDKKGPLKDDTAIYKKTVIQKEILLEASKAGRILTASEAAEIAATLSGEIQPVSGAVYDTSIATRFQIEWPRAFKAFLRNPLFGSGPSSITEATDGDYARWLGEFGLAGTFMFLFILYKLHTPMFLAWKNTKDDYKYLYSATLFATWGLLVNAGFIDVFEASKVAYTYWFFIAIISSLLIYINYDKNGTKKKTKRKKV